MTHTYKPNLAHSAYPTMNTRPKTALVSLLFMHTGICIYHGRLRRSEKWKTWRTTALSGKQ